MNYLDPSEFESYGLEETTPMSLVNMASALIDAHCRRETLAIAEYTERIRLNGCRPLRLTYLPLVAVLPALTPLIWVRVKVGVPRRGEINDLAFDAGQAFGLTNAWTAVAVESLEWDAETGEVNLPVHPLGLAYNEAEVRYTAGLETVSNAVKCACAQIVRNAQATPALNVKANGIDKMHMEYFSESLLDEDVRKMLAPFVAQKVG